MSLSDHILSQRREKLAELRRLGVDPYANRFQPSHSFAQVREQYD